MKRAPTSSAFHMLCFTLFDVLQVHTFYEAVGYMIGAQTDQGVQEHLIEKYMLLPNQVWDSIIQQATKVGLQHTTYVLHKQPHVKVNVSLL